MSVASLERRARLLSERALDQERRSAAARTARWRAIAELADEIGSSEAAIRMGISKAHLNAMTRGMRKNPGRRGRKPRLPGIAPELRAAVSRARMAYLRGESPTDEDKALAAEYQAAVKRHRRLQGGSR